MKFIKGLPKLEVFSEDGRMQIESLQYLDDQDDRLVLRFAEHIPLFKKGFVCDISLEYDLVGESFRNVVDTDSDYIADLVLVYVNKEFGVDSLPEFEYVFYK